MAGTCSIDGCLKEIECRSLCKMHYNRLQRNGSPLVLVRKPATVLIHKGYEIFRHRGVHIHIAEKALGRPIPKGARVHHADENKLNNDPSNLVICPDHSYHMLLHKRIRAMQATGDPNMRKCVICKEWDQPENLVYAPSVYSGKHKRCDAAYHAAWSAKVTCAQHASITADGNQHIVFTFFYTLTKFFIV